ncbi:MAG: alginate lyase family protein [Kofleriaceae bacterium]
MRWYWDRLRAMSPAEVLHRAKQLVRRRPQYDVPNLPTPTFAPRLPDDPDAIAMIRNGDRQVLGIGLVRATTRFEDPRLEYELARGHDWVAMASDRVWLDHELARWRLAHPVGSRVWVSPMEAAIRIFSLVFARGPAGMIFEHAAYVADHLSAYSSANNHLVVELAGIAVADRVLERPVDLARLEGAVRDQVGADGVQLEMATHYHAFVLEALALVAHVEAAYGVTHAWLNRTIEAMARYLAAVGALGQGDDDGGRIVPGFVLPTSTAPDRSHLFETSRQVVLRGDRVRATFDAGPMGFGTLAAHAHCDALAVNLAFDDRPFLVDRGTYSYIGPWRDRFRSTAMHNTLQVGSLEQATIAGPFLWRRVPDVRLDACELGRRDRVIGSHDGFAPAMHVRTVERDAETVVIRDRAPTALPLTARFHFPPGVKAEIRDRDVITDRGIITIEQGLPVLVTTPHSSHYGLLDQATTLEVRGSVDLAVSITPPRRS